MNKPDTISSCDRDRNSSTLCQAAIFHGVKQGFDICELAIPELSDGESLVRVESCTVCGSDLHTIFGRREEPTPIILGHEIVAVVDRITSPLHDLRGQPIRPGDRVVWSITRCCEGCKNCRIGIPQKCVRLKKFGHQSFNSNWPLSGGFAEYCVLPRGTSILKIPHEIPANAVSPSGCVTATAAAAIRYARPSFDDRALIIGGGLMGLTTAAMVAGQTNCVTLCDTLPDRLKLAQQFGATNAKRWDDLKEQAEESGDFDIVFEMSGDPKAVEMAIASATVGGRVILAGTVMPTRSISVSPEKIVRNLIQIQGVHNYAPQDLITAIDFLASNHTQFPFDSVVEKTFPLAAIEKAVEYAAEHKPIRIAIHPGRTQSE